MAELITPNCEITTVVPAGKKFTKYELCSLIGCNSVEGWDTWDGSIVIYDKYERLRGLPYNNEASARSGLELHGNVVYCSNEEFDL